MQKPKQGNICVMQNKLFKGLGYGLINKKPNMSLFYSMLDLILIEKIHNFENKLQHLINKVDLYI